MLLAVSLKYSILLLELASHGYDHDALLFRAHVVIVPHSRTINILIFLVLRLDCFAHV